MTCSRRPGRCPSRWTRPSRSSPCRPRFFDTLNTAGGEFGSITSWEVKNNLADLTGDLTTTDGDSLFGTNAGQLTVFGPFSSDNPIDVLCFTWTAADGVLIGDGPDTVAYETATSAMVLWVGDDKDSAVSMDANFSDTAFSWTVVPTPASAAPARPRWSGPRPSSPLSAIGSHRSRHLRPFKGGGVFIFERRDKPPGGESGASVDASGAA